MTSVKLQIATLSLFHYISFLDISRYFCFCIDTFDIQKYRYILIFIDDVYPFSHKPILQALIPVLQYILRLYILNCTRCSSDMQRNICMLRYVHTMPRGTQRQSATRLRGKSCAMPKVYVDVASAWLRHAVRCCAA